jgi:AcrR family transcriptional regulator
MVRTAPARRRRRPSDEVRTLLLSAARELFVENGYEGTTTIEICARAGVSERLLFSNFGTKAELFEAAVVGPFSEVIAEYVASWARESTDLDARRRIGIFAEGLLDLGTRNRALLLSALSRRRNRSAAEASMLDALARLFQGMEGLAELERELEGFRVDPPVTIAAAAAMVLGYALLDELLFPAGTRRPGRDRVAAELTEMILYGVSDRR